MRSDVPGWGSGWCPFTRTGVWVNSKSSCDLCVLVFIELLDGSDGSLCDSSGEPLCSVPCQLDSSVSSVLPNHVRSATSVGFLVCEGKLCQQFMCVWFLMASRHWIWFGFDVWAWCHLKISSEIIFAFLVVVFSCLNMCLGFSCVSVVILSDRVVRSCRLGWFWLVCEQDLLMCHRRLDFVIPASLVSTVLVGLDVGTLAGWSGTLYKAGRLGLVLSVRIWARHGGSEFRGGMMDSVDPSCCCGVLMISRCWDVCSGLLDYPVTRRVDDCAWTTDIGTSAATLSYFMLVGITLGWLSTYLSYRDAMLSVTVGWTWSCVAAVPQVDHLEAYERMQCVIGFIENIVSSGIQKRQNN